MRGKPKFLNRSRIRKKLENIFSYPLTIVHAPIGYGKTTEVRQFLEQCAGRADTAWVALAGRGGSADCLWAHFTHALPAGTLRGLLQKQGFPENEEARLELASCLAAHAPKRPFVLVLDDFQEIDRPEAFALVKRVAQARIKNLSVVLVTRDLSKLDAAELYQKQLCFTLTEKALKFNQEEIAQYFSMAGCELAEKDAEWIYHYTEGWISMIYVLLKEVQRGLPVGKSNTIDDIIEQNLYRPLGDKAREILCSLSFLESFTPSMALYVLDDPESSCILQLLIKQSTFIVYSELEKTYRIRGLLREFLVERAKFLRIDFQELRRRAGEWFLRERRYADAFEQLYRAGEAEAILAELDRENAPNLQLAQLSQIRLLFDSLTAEQCLKYPRAYLQYLCIQSTSGEPGSLNRCQAGLDKMQQYVECSALKEEYRNFLLGEISVVRVFAACNNLEAMQEYSRRAAKHFSGECSHIIAHCREFTFGSPHLTYCYYREKGGLKNVEKELAACSGSYGIECGAVVQTEYLLETGDFDHVEQCAYKALYKARAARQISLVLCAQFALARLEILRGGHTRRGMEAVREEIAHAGDPVLSTALALCGTYLDTCLGHGRDTAGQMCSGELPGASFLSQGRAFYYTAYARAIMLAGDYIRLEAECEMASGFFAFYHNQLGHLHNFICLSVARRRLYGMSAGCETLKKALEIGAADDIVMPFAESAFYIQDMLAQLQKEAGACPYLARLLRLCAAYCQSVEELRADRVVLTSREKEILQLLERGCKHEEIGRRLFISVTTVRYHIKNIYQKLEVNNRALAVKKAQELRLL